MKARREWEERLRGPQDAVLRRSYPVHSKEEEKRPPQKFALLDQMGSVDRMRMSANGRQPWLAQEVFQEPYLLETRLFQDHQHQEKC